MKQSSAWLRMAKIESMILAASMFLISTPTNAYNKTDHHTKYSEAKYSIHCSKWKKTAEKLGHEIQSCTYDWGNDGKIEDRSEHERNTAGKTTRYSWVWDGQQFVHELALKYDHLGFLEKMEEKWYGETHDTFYYIFEESGALITEMVRNKEGAPVRQRSDTNGDGRLDLTELLEGGTVYQRTRDTNGDEKDDLQWNFEKDEWEEIK